MVPEVRVEGEDLLSRVGKRHLIESLTEVERRQVLRTVNGVQNFVLFWKGVSIRDHRAVSGPKIEHHARLFASHHEYGARPWRRRSLGMPVIEELAKGVLDHLSAERTESISRFGDGLCVILERDVHLGTVVEKAYRISENVLVTYEQLPELIADLRWQVGVYVNEIGS